MNYVFSLIVLISIVFGLINGTIDLVVASMFEGCRKTLDISLYLIGILAFWSGIMKIAEKSGLLAFFADRLSLVFEKIFPEIPKKHPVFADISLNFVFNAFGLANAATPVGLEAMKQLSQLNIDKKSASNSMCTLLAMNTAGFQLVPTSVIAILLTFGMKNPEIIILPTLLVTSFTFVFAILCAMLFAKFYPAQVESESEI